MAISACFSRAKVAAACAGVIYYGFYFPYNLWGRFEDDLSILGKLAFCLFSPSAMGVGIGIIAKWELLEEGLQFSNLATASPLTQTGNLPKDDFSVLHVILMFIFDSCLYQFFAWYIEKVLPGTFGLPQPFYFLFLPSYWRGDRAATEELDIGTDAESKDNEKILCYEAAPPHVEVVATIRKLSKTFSGGKKALRGISLDMHRGSIIGLLGHNGAGKSTTMSILTGLYPPTSGDVCVGGCSVRKDSLGVRKQLGVCLQHNALWENLTVEEHLTLFANLKGVPRGDVKSEVTALLRDTGLEPKRYAITKALSGGMKRKLSIGIALIGGSKLIALDEPTAGVDATSRRDIWTLLATYKAGRSILLSTHFMDEADVLSDRIAIIAEGSIMAIGSSLALKRKFADAYMLVVVTDDGADPAQLHHAVRGTIPEAKWIGSRGREHSFALPASARSRFSNLFETLEDPGVRARTAIQTYGLSAATMEEVFLQASSMHEEGLHGMVRNAAEVLNAVDDGSTVAGSARPETASSGSTETLSARGSNGENSNSGSKPKSPRVSEGDNSDSSSKPKSPRASQGENVDPVSEPKSPRILEQKGPGVDIAGQAAHVYSLYCPQEEPADGVVPGGKVPAFPVDKKHEEAETAGFEREVELIENPLTRWTQQLVARVGKRFLACRRDGKAWLSQLLLPSAFVLLALLIAKILQDQPDAPALRLSMDMFADTIEGNHLVPMAVDVSSGDVLSTRAAEAFRRALGDSDEVRQQRVDKNSSSHDVMSTYLLNSNQELLRESFAAVSVGKHESQRGNFTSVKLWFKDRAVHALPVAVSLCNAARHRLLGFSDVTTEAWSHPLPKTQALLEEDMIGSSQLMTDFSVAITIILAMGFIPASFVVYVVHERGTNGKHQQLLTGVSPVMYWISTYCWDMINFLVPTIIIFVIFQAFQIGAYSGENSLAVFLILFLYGACMTPLMYCCECLFAVPSTAYVTMICANIFTGTASLLTTMVLDFYEAEMPSVKRTNDAMKLLFSWLLPNYNLGNGLQRVAMNYYQNKVIKMFGICWRGKVSNCLKDPLEWDVSGKLLCYMAIMSIVWIVVRLFIEWGFLSRLWNRRKSLLSRYSGEVPTSGDVAVKAEYDRVAKAVKDGSLEDTLVIYRLMKSFVKTGRFGCTFRCGRSELIRSVRGVSVGVRGGECFGLLGVNGAGKTTTMRMVTGDLEVDSGDVWLAGDSVKSRRDKARRHLGYCPQFDALPDKLTARETLHFYARIRGVVAEYVEPCVESIIKRMCLESHQHCLCQFLSGGNRRKLSTALALIGDPEVVLLDEPSTGVDVGARRFLWEVLGGIRSRGHALILTSHSMDECEVLCSRLTVMVGGEFRCLGSPVQLKDLYGGGYTLTVKALPNGDVTGEKADAVDPVVQIREFMSKAMPQAVLAEENVGLFRYRLGGDRRTTNEGGGNQVNLASLFSAFEQALLDGGSLGGFVSDYAVSQTSLEEVFLHFSRVADQEQAPAATTSEPTDANHVGEHTSTTQPAQASKDEHDMEATAASRLQVTGR
eukprot:TRINITY_DN7598_c0_g1_i2.p1 TRINITY_DN7598_c0_g1~~TRINITY_DN7598_c0_g1_i2.p1  ORF type:complete len:1645 (-),score=336.37 TRINITY_DN7598_c0_g1_i2:294-4913(-)